VGDQSHAPAALPLGKRPSTHCTGRWVWRRDGLDAEGKSRPLPGFPNRLSLVESLYPLLCPSLVDGSEDKSVFTCVVRNAPIINPFVIYS
jgi:hypothetical protein